MYLTGDWQWQFVGQTGVHKQHQYSLSSRRADERESKTPTSRRREPHGENWRKEMGGPWFRAISREKDFWYHWMH